MTEPVSGSGPRGKNAFIDADVAMGAVLPTHTSSYDVKDLALYGLAVGAGRDPLDKAGLRWVFEQSSGFQALPTFGVIPAINAFMKMLLEDQRPPGLHYGLDRVLHGEQYTELLRPLPTSATLEHRGRVLDVQDKGKHAVVVYGYVSHDASTGEPLVRNEVSTLIRGAGGFAPERTSTPERHVPPDRAPDAVVEERTEPNQALLYRLCGDWNPLHADPDFAQQVGYPRPILHGLCTFGFIGRQVVQTFADHDASAVASIRARFSDVVFPGETLVTELWREGRTITVRTSSKERGKVVVSNAAVVLR